MDLLIEFIVELVAEGCCEIAESKKVSKWIRYPIIFILSVAILSVIVFVGFLGVKMIMSTEQYYIYGGLLLILIDVVFIIYGTGKIIKKFKSRKSDR